MRERKLNKQGLSKKLCFDLQQADKNGIEEAIEENKRVMDERSRLKRMHVKTTTTQDFQVGTKYGSGPLIISLKIATLLFCHHPGGSFIY